ncbi:hypothetical protein A2U01_0067074, partial [Trifolium medium]|nr:hypothetical protein [Trifolium medium]
LDLERKTAFLMLHKLGEDSEPAS